MIKFVKLFSLFFLIISPFSVINDYREYKVLKYGKVVKAVLVGKQTSFIGKYGSIKYKCENEYFSKQVYNSSIGTYIIGDSVKFARSLTRPYVYTIYGSFDRFYLEFISTFLVNCFFLFVLFFPYKRG